MCKILKKKISHLSSTLSMNPTIPPSSPDPFSVLPKTTSSLWALSHTLASLYLKYCTRCCGTASASYSAFAKSPQWLKRENGSS